MPFPIRFNLSADDRASEALRAVTEVLRQGTRASDDAKEKMKMFTENVNLQNRAMNSLRTQLRVAHSEWMLLGRTLSSIGSIGHSMLSIFTGLSTAGLRLADAKRTLAKATEDVFEAERRWEEFRVQKGPEHPETLKAHAELIKLRNELTAATNQVADAELSSRLTFAGSILTLVGVGSQITNMVVSLKLLTISLSTASTIVGGAAVLGGFFALLGALSFATAGAIKLRLETGKWPTTFAEATEALAKLPSGIREIGAVLLAGTGQIGDFVEKVPAWFNILEAKLAQWRSTVSIGFSEWWNSTARGFFEWTTEIGTTIGSWGSSVVGFFENLPQRIGVALAALASIVGSHVKGALNLAIDLLNGFISFVNSLINNLNSMIPPSLPRIPTLSAIPRLAQGGIVTRPTLAIIGEAGPEAVLPLRNTAASSTSTVNIYVQGSIVTEKEISDMVSRRLFLEFSRLSR